MFPRVTVPFTVFLVVVSVGPSLAAPSNPYGLTQQELTMSVIVNQLAILQGMNESTSSSSSHGDELNQLREDMEMGWEAMNKTVVEGRIDINDEIEGMNGTLQTGITELSKTMNNEIKRLNETGESRARLMNEINGKIQSMDGNIQRQIIAFGEQMETEINNKIDAINQTVHRKMDEMNEKRMHDTQRIMEKLEALQNATAVHRQQPEWAELYANHNDTDYSLCDGHKELFGGDGAFTVAALGENYANNMDCSWTVTLPGGSRPVFWWQFFDIPKCNNTCKCDYMYLRDVEHTSSYWYCGDKAPNESFLTVMNNKFIIKFHSDGSGTGRGFRLWYRAVEMMAYQ